MSIPAPEPPIGHIEGSPLGELGNPLGSLSAGRRGSGGGGKLLEFPRRGLGPFGATNVAEARRKIPPAVLAQKPPQPRQATPRAARNAPVRSPQPRQAAPAAKPATPPSPLLTRYGAPVRYPRQIPKKGTRAQARAAMGGVLGKDEAGWFEGQSPDVQQEFHKVIRAGGKHAKHVANKGSIDALRAMRQDIDERRRDMQNPSHRAPVVHPAGSPVAKAAAKRQQQFDQIDATMDALRQKQLPPPQPNAHIVIGMGKPPEITP